MARSVEDWGDRFERKPVSTFVQAAAIVVVICFGIAALVWGIKTNFSYWWGQAGVIQQQNNSGNIIAQQARFQRDLAQIDQDRTMMGQEQMAIDQFTTRHPNYQGNGSPYDPVAEQATQLDQALLGTEQACAGTVGDYNAAAGELLSEHELPAGGEPHLDSATQCAPPGSH